MTDPIADFLIRIKNAAAVDKTTVSVPFSQIKFAVAKELEAMGYLASVEKHGKKVKKTLEVTLALDATGRPRVRDVRRISKPSRRVYFRMSEIRPIKHGYGALVLSTPKGIMSGDAAKKQKIGGEALFEIW